MPFLVLFNGEKLDYSVVLLNELFVTGLQFGTFHFEGLFHQRWDRYYGSSRVPYKASCCGLGPR